MYLYEASGLEPGPQRLEDDEDIQVDVVSVDEALRMTRDGRIRDAKTLVGLLIVLRPSRTIPPTATEGPEAGPPRLPLR